MARPNSKTTEKPATVASSFDELETIFKRIRKHRQETLMVLAAPSDPNEDLEQRFTDAEMAAREARYDAFGEKLDAIHKGLESGDLESVHEAVVVLSEGQHLPPRARAQLGPLINAIRLLRSARAYTEVSLPTMSAAALNVIHQRIETSVAELSRHLTPAARREENALQIEEVAIDLPLLLKRIAVVDEVPVVFSAESRVSAKNARSVGSGIYITTARLIGVPRSSQSTVTKAFEKARTFAIKNFKKEPHPNPLTRPDGDVYWFAILSFQVQTSVILFPDQVNTYDTSSYTPEAIAARIAKQRAAREKFEEANRALYSVLEQAIRQYHDCKERAALARTEFIATYDMLPNTRWDRIAGALRKALESRVSNDRSAVSRLTARLDFFREIFSAEYIRNIYLANLTTARLAKQRRISIQHEIDSLKLDIVQPHREATKELRAVLET